MSNFLDNKYTRWYYALVEKRALDKAHTNSELHHIIPRSLGGTDDPANLVRLSYHDHAWCHWLLTKMTEGAALAKMRYAFNMMNIGGDHMGRVMDRRIVLAYEKNRKELIRIHREFMTGKEPWNKGLDMKNDPRCKGGKKNKGRVKTQEEIEKRRLKVIGRKDTEETKRKKRDAQKGIPRGPQSEETKKKKSIALKGKSKPTGFSEKCADRMKTEFTNNNPNKREDLKKKCPHCGGIFGPTNCTRWHGDKCKHKK